MKLYTIRHQNKIYTVKAKDSNSAVKAVKDAYTKYFPDSIKNIRVESFWNLQSIVSDIQNYVNEVKPGKVDDSFKRILERSIKDFDSRLKECKSELVEIDNLYKTLSKGLEQAEKDGKHLISKAISIK